MGDNNKHAQFYKYLPLTTPFTNIFLSFMKHIHYHNVTLYAATHLHGYKVHTRHCRTALGHVEDKYQIMQCITDTNTLIFSCGTYPMQNGTVYY